MSLPVGKSGIWKIFSKPVWWWERHRPYPIRQKIWESPPILSSQESSVSLAVLTVPSHAEEVAWCAASILKVLRSPVCFKIVVDGEWGAENIARLSKLFPQVRLIRSSEYVDRYATLYPSLHHLACTHPMGRKMLVVLGLQEESDVIYGDDDLLSFAAMDEIDQWICTSDSPNMYLQDVAGICEEPSLHKTIVKKQMPYARTINVGFMLIRKGSFGAEIAESLISESEPVRTWFPDTSLIGALMGENGVPLSREKYVVSAARQFCSEVDVDYSQICLRHFTQPVRHLMYAKGMPFLWKKWHG